MPASGEIVGIIVAAFLTGYTGCLAWCMLTSYLHGRELEHLKTIIEKLHKGK